MLGHTIPVGRDLLGMARTRAVRAEIGTSYAAGPVTLCPGPRGGVDARAHMR